MLQNISCDEIQWSPSANVFGIPQLHMLIMNNSATVQKLLQDQQEQQKVNHDEVKDLLLSQAEILNQIAATQAEMAHAYGQVVTLLQNISTTMNIVASVLENQQKTLENISRSLPVVLEQQANQTELLSQCPPRPTSNCSDVESNRFQTTQATIITTNPTMATSTDRITQDTTTLRSVEFPIQDCSELDTNGRYPSGIYTITPTNGVSFDVYCDVDTADGGWTVFQKRFNGSVDFYRGWDEYEQGFGHLNSEFWLGLRKIHQLTQSGTWALRVDLEHFNGDSEYAIYDSFHIGDADSNYRLSIGSYSGTAGDSMTGSSSANNMQFSTYDRDNDDWAGGDCAGGWQGAWWYRACSSANLNGRYLGPSGTAGMFWHWPSTPSLKKSEMKIRRVQ